MSALLLTVLGASLAGSVHCAGMCGPLVALTVGGSPSVPRALAAQAPWHLGRAIIYAGLGALAGAIGTALDLAAALAGAPRIAMLAAGAVLVILGVRSIVRRGASGAACPSIFRSRIVRRLAALAPSARALVLGLLCGALPCGWLYAAVLVAAGSGSWSLGSLVMIAFWAGTIPALVGVSSLGILLPRLLAPLQRHGPLIAGVVMLVFGFHALRERQLIDVGAFSVLPVSSEAKSETNERDADPDAASPLREVPPCCREES